MKVRADATSDRAAIRRVHAAAFETAFEADLVDALRDRVAPVVSVVAEVGDAVVGHALFTPVVLEAVSVMGLGPVAVADAWRNRGVGSALVTEGLAQCRALGVGAVVVIGDPMYYRRFGFEAASRFGIACAFDVPADAFMALELEAGYLRARRGMARYHERFGDA